MNIVIISKDNLPPVLGMKAEDILKMRFKNSEIRSEIPDVTEQNTFYISAEFVCFSEELFALQSRRGEKIGQDRYSLSNPSNYSKIVDTIRKAKTEELKSNGVLFENEDSTFISPDCRIEKGAFIMHDCMITGGSMIESGAIIKPYTCIDESKVGKGTSVGPSANLRKGTQIGDRCRIGDFVEIKNSYIGDGTKIAHLAYVGDSCIGENTNVGCGVVFANYDGKAKHFSKVGNNCFIGCNVNLVSPVNIGNDVFIAAGSTVTKDLKDGAFCIARSPETVKEKNKKT